MSICILYFLQTWTMIFLMELEMGRTICKKHDENMDNCPLLQGSGENHPQLQLTFWERKDNNAKPELGFREGMGQSRQKEDTF